MALGRSNEWGRPELTRKFMKATPGQWKRKWKQMVEETLGLGDVASKTAQYHSTLNPLLWGPGNTLKDDVRIKLLQMADAYEKTWTAYHPTVIDVILTGSNANYNWTEYSDIDVHLVYAVTSIPAYNAYGEQQTDDEYRERVEEYLHQCKGLFNMNNLKVMGINVEVFPQRLGEPLSATGIFSLRNNRWISEPNFEPPRFNHPAIVAKAEYLAREIDFALDFRSLYQLETLNTKIADLRRAGLQREGEFSTENMVFKVLRNAGAIGRLRAMIHRLKAEADKPLSNLPIV